MPFLGLIGKAAGLLGKKKLEEAAKKGKGAFAKEAGLSTAKALLSPRKAPGEGRGQRGSLSTLTQQAQVTNPLEEVRKRRKKKSGGITAKRSA